MSQRRHTRVFFASSSDVLEERDAAGLVVEGINRDVGDLLNVQLELVRWETHAAPGAGAPQQVVFDDIGDYDVFIGLMWRRYGIANPDEESGTVQEYRDAVARRAQDLHFPILFYFCEAPFYTRSLEEVEQFRRVLEFRQQIRGKQLDWPFGDRDGFGDLLRGHLIQRLKTLKSSKGQLGQSKPDPRTQATLKRLWPKLTVDARTALSSAFNVSGLMGDGGIKTSALFATLDQAAEGKSRELIDSVPDAGLSPGDVEFIDPSPNILHEPAWFSPCVTESIEKLSIKADSGLSISSADLFVDLAKHGRGASVRRLRQHDIGPREIDNLVRASGISIVER